jgi:hypothetical protein
MTDEEVEEKMALWDRLHAEASKYDHLCGFENGKCRRGEPSCCMVQPGGRRPLCDNLDPESGCRINSIMCKTWFCGFIKELHPELKPLVEKWADEAMGLPGVFYFQSREDYESSLKGGRSGHAASMG